MMRVSCQDTAVSKKERHMSHHEALLHEHYSRLAAAANALDELHDGCDIDDFMYGLALQETHRVMRKLEQLIEDEQRSMVLKWPEPNVDTDKLFIPSSGGCFEITRLRVKP